MGSVKRNPTKRFRVALSFPGEHRDLVEAVATSLARSFGRRRILYDRFHEAEFARLNLDTHLQRLYHDESDLVVVFLCEAYERKEWPGLEWRAIHHEVEMWVGAVLVREDQDLVLIQIQVTDEAVRNALQADGVHRVARIAAHREVVDGLPCTAHRLAGRSRHHTRGRVRIAGRKVSKLHPLHTVALPLAAVLPRLQVRDEFLEAPAQRMGPSDHRRTSRTATWMRSKAFINSSSAGNASMMCAWCVSSLRERPASGATGLADGNDERVRAAGAAGGGPHGIVGDADRGLNRGRDVVHTLLLGHAFELVEVVEQTRELPDQLVRAAPAHAWRQLSRKRGFAHIAERRDAASAGGFLDVAPLLGGPAGGLLNGAARRHAGRVVGVFFERSEKRAYGEAAASGASEFGRLPVLLAPDVRRSVVPRPSPPRPRPIRAT